MTFLFEDKLREKALAFIQQLTERDIAVEPEPTMFRDYMVKLTVQGLGSFAINYSPKKDAFSLQLTELREASLITAIQSCWHQPERALATSPSQTEFRAYVDGSYLNETVGYGAVILQNGEEIERFSGIVSSDTEMHQVAGELAATLRVIDWCLEHKVTALEVYFDYEGIQKWATGEWKANKTATQHYQSRMQSLSISINVIWKKVKSHSGDHWNDIVDGLAKEAANSTPVAKTAQTSIVDPLIEAERMAMSFVEYLNLHEQNANFDRILNGQCARIRVSGGYFDLYNTPKKPMSPYIHGMKEELRHEIDQLWNMFFLGSKSQSSETLETKFAAVDYYLEFFRPYRQLAFDFTPLAEAISVLSPNLSANNEVPFDDFDILEQIYLSLRNNQ